MRGYFLASEQLSIETNSFHVPSFIWSIIGTSFVPSHGNDSSPVKGLSRQPMGNRGDAMFVAERCLTVCKLDGLHKRLVALFRDGQYT
jgi:hypothetical protein